MSNNDLTKPLTFSYPTTAVGIVSESLRIDERVKWMVLDRLNRLETRTAASISLGIGIAKLEGYMRQFNICQEKDRGRYYIKEKKIHMV